jgi:hypothetical protein
VQGRAIYNTREEYFTTSFGCAGRAKTRSTYTTYRYEQNILTTGSYLPIDLSAVTRGAVLREIFMVFINFSQKNQSTDALSPTPFYLL